MLRRALLAFVSGITAHAGTLTVEQRLADFPTANLPISSPVTVRWNEHQIPFVEAGSDDDLAFALGMVHAHLRIGQMEVLRRISQGRLAEMAGPFAIDLDHALRILDLGAATPLIEQQLPPETRRWLERFVLGINVYRAASDRTRRPREFRWLGLRDEPWTVRDVLTLSRLAGADVNWFDYFAAIRQPPTPEAWRRRLDAGTAQLQGTMATRDNDRLETLRSLLQSSGRHGSNSVALASARSTSGGALLANDPHLGLALPNFWVLAGARSPSFHVVGMMIPGLPIWGLGRNPRLGWGGTNMRAASTDLVDVTDLPDDQISSRAVPIRVRWWRDRTRLVRQTPYGPMISDAKLLKTPPGKRYALNWVGHRPSDEITAFLRAARAHSVDDFRKAWSRYAVSGQTMLAADDTGRIARVLAVSLPAQTRGFIESPIVRHDDPRAQWQTLAGPDELPALVDPVDGLIVSSNDRPPPGPVPIGFSFGHGERYARLRELASSQPKLSLRDLIALQQDTYSREAHRLAQALHERLAALPGEREQTTLTQLASWNGHYDQGSTGAPVFESLLFHLLPRIHGGEKPSNVPSADRSWTGITAYLLTDLEKMDPPRREQVLRDSLRKAARDTRRRPTWGEWHEVRVAHLLGAVPLVGRAWTVDTFPGSGSRDTVLKSDHDLVNRRHRPTYGSQSRFVSDLADPDANYFVLFGGNDGWWHSTTFADQVPLWREGELIQLPLTQTAVERTFPHPLTLRPTPVP